MLREQTRGANKELRESPAIAPDYMWITFDIHPNWGSTFSIRTKVNNFSSASCPWCSARICRLEIRLCLLVLQMELWRFFFFGTARGVSEMRECIFESLLWPTQLRSYSPHSQSAGSQKQPIADKNAIVSSISIWQRPKMSNETNRFALVIPFVRFFVLFCFAPFRFAVPRAIFSAPTNDWLYKYHIRFVCSQVQRAMSATTTTTTS